MRITSLAYRDFKGLTGKIELGKFTLLTGPNGSGKTARLLGPQFAVTGRTPFGARPEDAFKLAGPVGCQVSVWLDDDTAFSRDLLINARTKALSTGLKIAGQDGLGLRAAESWVKQHVGDFAPMFDLGTFLDLSSDKRRAFVLELCAKCDSVGAPPAQFYNALLLEEVLKVELGGGTVVETLAHGGDMAHTILMAKLGTDKAKCLNDILDTVRMSLNMDPATAIAESLNEATGALNQSKTTRDQALQASRKLSEQKATIETTAGTVEQLKEKRDGLVEKQKEIAGQLENQAGRESARAALQVAKIEAATRLRTWSEHLGMEMDRAAVDKERRQELEAEIAALQVEVPQPDLTGAMTAKCEADKALLGTRDELLTLRNTLSSLESEKWTCERAIEVAKKSPWQEALFHIDTLAPYIQAKPFCDAPSTATWRELSELIRKWASADDVESHQKRLVLTESSIVETQKKIDVLGTKQGIQATLVEQTTKKLEDAQKESHLYAMDALARSVTMQEAKQKLLEIDNRGKELERLAADQSRLEKESVAAEKAFNDLEAEGGFVPEAELKEQLDLLVGQIKIVGDFLAAKERYAVLDTELTRCIASAEHEALYHETCKSVCQALRNMREQLMERLIAPLLDRVNGFLSVAEPECQAYCELVNAKGKPTFELGWTRQAKQEAIVQKTPLPALSAGESATFGAALAYALVTLSDAPLKLLLLEAGEVDEVHLERILQAIDANREDLSNVMVATHVRPKFNSGSWQTVSLW